MSILRLIKNKQKLSEHLYRCTNAKLKERLSEELRLISINIQSFIYMASNSKNIEAKFLLEVASRSINTIELSSRTVLPRQ